MCHVLPVEEKLRYSTYFSKNYVNISVLIVKQRNIKTLLRRSVIEYKWIIDSNLALICRIWLYLWNWENYSCKLETDEWCNRHNVLAIVCSLKLWLWVQQVCALPMLLSKWLVDIDAYDFYSFLKSLIASHCIPCKRIFDFGQLRSLLAKLSYISIILLKM